MEQQWCDLLSDLVIDIEQRLVLTADKIRFRCVCKSWKSYLPDLKFPNNNKFPCLLHPLAQNRNNTFARDVTLQHFSRFMEIAEDESQTRAEAEAESRDYGIFCPVEKRVYHSDIPDAKGVFFKGSSYGWVVTIQDTVTGTGPDMYLINPLINARIQLPPRSKFPDVFDYHPDQIGTESEYTMKTIRGDGTYDTSSDHVNLYLLKKVVLSSTPLREDCVIVAIYGEFMRLAYCKCGDTEWKLLYGESGFTDLIFHKGKLHALDHPGHVLVFEDIGHNPKITQIPAAPPTELSSSHYLVESSAGELIMAVRNHFDYPSQSNTFTVYQLDPANSTWVQTKNIGDDTLFLGWNSSLAVASRDFPGHKGNCIYFTDDFATLELTITNEGVFVGVFDLEDECFHSLPGYNYAPKLVWPPPVWITPSTF